MGGNPSKSWMPRSTSPTHSVIKGNGLAAGMSKLQRRLTSCRSIASQSIGFIRSQTTIPIIRITSSTPTQTPALKISPIASQPVRAVEKPTNTNRYKESFIERNPPLRLVRSPMILAKDGSQTNQITLFSHIEDRSIHCTYRRKWIK